MIRSLTLFLSTFLFLSSCVTITQPNNRYPNEKTSGGDQDNGRGRDRDERIYPFSALGIPKGHLPPPGECKIWIPGIPAGQQGPPQSCGSAFHDAPLGAWVITHAGNRYKVNVLSSVKRAIVVEVRFYALP